ncbi:hypothetical protein [Salinigranum sp.]|uniref:DUF7289 family protein n=1 Tax=Salinigranum sp. TaxID=1966351 RepID=UPI003565C5F5
MNSSGERIPWLYRFVRDRSAQSETVGVVLILAITIVGTTAVVALGSNAIGGTQSQSATTRAEHAMTLFDSQAATVGLGDSPVRRVSFGGDEGSYAVVPDAGRLTVTHVNFDGGANNDADDVDNPGVSWADGDDDVNLYSGELGAVVYRNDETTIAYQGGGVWRTDGQGRATMVSPPEFHYRGATLTLPVILVRGSGGAGGAATAKISRNAPAVREFPAPTATYPNGDPYDNPSEKGRITITVESEYANAWGDYFEERTDGNITYPAADTVRLELVSTGLTGGFTMPNEGSAIEIRGLYGGHNLDEFEIALRPDDTDSADFANLEWSMYAESGSRQFEAHLAQGTGSGCSATADVVVFYSEDGGTTYESWVGEDAFTAQCSDLNGDGDDEVKLVADFKSTTLLRNEKPSGQLVHFSNSGSRDTTPTFDQHPGATLGAAGNESYEYADGESEQLGTLMSHYLGLMGPGIDLTVDDKSSDSISESASYGSINYPANDRFVTYIHVSENEIRVEFV